MPRYFFAIRPPDPSSDRIEMLRARWGHPHHPVEPHATVKIPFAWVGDSEGFLAPVRAACAGVRPFAVRLGEPGRFPEAQVLYLSVASEGLPGLHRAVIGALDGLVPLDPRGHEGEGYHPHMTLAVGRFGITPEGLEQMEAEARRELADLPAFQVGALRCYRRERRDDPWAPFADIPLGC